MKRLQKHVLRLCVLWGGLFSLGLYGSSCLHFSSRSSAINLQSGAKFVVGNAITGFTGLLIKDESATISGSSISFERGSYEEAGRKAVFSGSLNPTTNQISLDGSKTLLAKPGRILKGVAVSGTNNRIEGAPSFTSSLVFDSNATMTIALQNSLNQNLQFDTNGSNTVLLESDLSLCDNVTLVNNGTIDVNGRRFSFGGKELRLSNQIHWRNAGDITLNGILYLDGTWYFNEESVLNGNGNVLDVSGGGVLDVAASTTLHLTDIYLRGVTDSTFVFGDVGSTVRLSNVTIQVDDDISFAQGMFYVDGPSTFVLHGNDWTFGSASKLTVSAVTLWLDKAGNSSIGNLVFSGDSNYSQVNWGTYLEVASGGNFEEWVEATSEAVLVLDSRVDTAEANISTNASDIDTNQTNIATNVSGISTNGDNIAANSEAIVVLDSRVDTAETNIFTNSSDISTNQTNISTNASDIGTNQTNISTNVSDISTNAANIASGEGLLKFIHGPADYTLSSNTTLTVDLWLSNEHNLAVGSDITLNGNDHSITFAKGGSGPLSVGSNALTLENVSLKNFSPNSISLTTGSVTFGDGTVIEMYENSVIMSSNYTMSCSGAVELNCFGNELDISHLNHALDILASSTLSIRNARIKGLGGTNGTSRTNNIRCVGSDSTLTLSNCTLVLEDDYCFTQGFLSFCQDVSICGPEIPHGTGLIFAYKSPMPATIHSLGHLLFDRYITFSYDSDAARKDRIVMEDQTSILHLNGCTLYSTHTGIELSGGRLIIEDKVTVQNEADNKAEAAVLKEPLEIDLLSGGVFDLQGLLEYR